MRVFERQLLFLVLQVEDREQLVATAADRVPRHQMNAADERQILACRQVIKKCQVFRNDPHPALRLERLAGIEHVPPQHHHLPAGSTEQSRQHLHRRRLARAIGPQEPIKRPSLDGQVDAADGAKVIEISRQLMRFDRQGHGHRSPVSLIDGLIDNNTAHGTRLAALHGTQRKRAQPALACIRVRRVRLAGHAADATSNASPLPADRNTLVFTAKNQPNCEASNCSEKLVLDSLHGEIADEASRGMAR